MIHYAVGDLLQAEENFIIHSCNCQGVMGSGIALQVKQQYPEAYQGYRDYVRSHFPEDVKDLLGKVNVVQVGENRYIVNLFGQEKYGYDGAKYTSYDALHDGFTRVYQVAKDYGMSVAIPYKIGCHRGGADWHVVIAMIESIFRDVKVKIYQYDKD